jgi:pimeloyl-ACP methyl ester carboxylesterase
MATFQRDGIEIAFLDEGEGEPIVLVHGFASTKEVNWVNTAWVTTLTRAGRRVIALDNRGHGQSIRPSIIPPRWRTTSLRCSIISRSSVPM